MAPIPEIGDAGVVEFGKARAWRARGAKAPRGFKSLPRRQSVEINDEYIVVNIPQTKTIYRPVPIPLAGESVIQDATFLDSALNACTSLMQYLNGHPGYPSYPSKSQGIQAPILQ